MVTPKAPIPRKRLIIAASLAAFLLVSGATYYAYSSKSNKPPKLSQVPSLKQALNGGANNPPTLTQGSQATQVTLTASPTPTGSSLSDQDEGNGKHKSTDSSLKIKLEYMSQIDNGNQSKINVKIKKDGNKLIIYPENTPFVNDYVQVFSKDPNDTLNQAITKTILKGYNPSDCQIGWAYGVGKGEYPSNIQTVSLRYNSNNTYVQSGHPIDDTKCPLEYTAVENSHFFLLDSNQPSRFLFVSDNVPLVAGQDSKGQYIGWQDTLTLF